MGRNPSLRVVPSRRYKPSPIQNSKVARKRMIDDIRSRRIASTSEPDHGSLIGEESANSVQSSGGPQAEFQNEQQQHQLEQKEKLASQANRFLLQLGKCLSGCSRELLSVPHSAVTANFKKLVDAVGNASYMAERVRVLTIKNTLILRSLTQSAASLSTVVHMHTHNSLRNESAMFPHHCLARARRLLALASRVARVLHDFTWSMDPPPYWKPSLGVPFFLKSPSLDYDRAHRLQIDLLCNNITKQEECSAPAPPLEMAKANTEKSCDFVEVCRSLRQALHVVQLPVAQSTQLHVMRADDGQKHQRYQSAQYTSKVARNVHFDQQREKRMAAMLKTESEEDEPPEYEEPEDSSDDSDSDEDSSDEESGDEDIEGDSEGPARFSAKKKEVLEQMLSLNDQLAKCLRACTEEVYSITPQHVRPNIDKLKDALNNTLFATELARKRVSHILSLKRLTQRAFTIARLVHAPRNAMYDSSPALKYTYRCILRTRRLLSQAVNITSQLTDLVEQLLSAGGHFESRLAASTCTNLATTETSEMINDLLWKARREAEQRQSIL